MIAGRHLDFRVGSEIQFSSSIHIPNEPALNDKK